MEFSALLGMVIFIKYIAIFRSLRELSVFWKVYGHLFAVIRFWFLELPNAWIKFFVAICSAFQHFPLGIKYFLTLLNPLFPRVPVLTVVKYGVKNASWPGAAGVCQPRLGSVFSWEKLLGFQQLLDGIHGRPLIPDLRIVIRLSAAHPAGAVDLSLGQPSGGTVFPRKETILLQAGRESFPCDESHACAVCDSNCGLCSIVLTPWQFGPPARVVKETCSLTGSLSAKKKKGDNPLF